ncbi:MAG TPA: G8 domain-containing protein [Flavisolibacter sp.]|jgi:hypothetical protein|nr:G8 domain-containing protein [Flavisolibacter sp.]
MKKVKLTVVFILIFYSSFAGSIQATQNNGQWTSNSTWDLNRNPANGDTIIIPAGITVLINSNINLSTSTMRVIIYGTLKFTGGGSKLAINSLSEIIVEAGGVVTSTGSPSQTLKIGSNTVFTGTDAPVVGPQFANNTTGNGFDPFISLPVKFIGFSLSLSSHNVLVQWTTAEEVNAYQYQVERSTDGNVWTIAGIVSATGNTSTSHNYSFTDHLYVVSKEYYRIKEIDLTGQFSYTTIKEIFGQSSSLNAVKIYSTSSGTAIVEFPQQFNDKVYISIISFNGQIVYQQLTERPVGQYILSTGKTGSYIIQVTNKSNLNVTQKVML